MTDAKQVEEAGALVEVNAIVMPLPCPFCGSAPKNGGRRATPGEERKPGMEYVSWYVCYCGGYGANAHRMAFGSTQEQAQEKALVRWNVRA